LRVSRKAPLYPAHWHSYGAGTLRYAIYLATRHNIDPYKLFSAFVEAETKGAVTCGPLEITLRRRADNHAIFLLTRDSEILGQIRVGGICADRANGPLSRLISRARLLRSRENIPCSIRELREGVRNVSLRGRVTEKSEVVRRYSRDTGRVVRSCVAIVTDPTGSVRLPLWDNQVNAVSVGDEIEVKNAAVVTFRGLLHIVPTDDASELAIKKLQRTARTEQATEAATKRSRQPIVLHSQNVS